jgi:hypothetical protein
MKQTITYILIASLILGLNAPAFGKSKPRTANSKEAVANQTMPESAKGAVAVPGPFRVNQVMFHQVSINNKTYLAAAVIFNRNIDAATVQQNVNIRLLRKNENNFWVDASTQNNSVRINPSNITWLSGAPLQSGFYKMHLRGTIKSADGVYLDCNGDGKGEGGYLPAYESQLYQAAIIELVPKE